MTTKRQGYGAEARQANAEARYIELLATFGRCEMIGPYLGTGTPTITAAWSMVKSTWLELATVGKALA